MNKSGIQRRNLREMNFTELSNAKENRSKPKLLAYTLTPSHAANKHNRQNKQSYQIKNKPKRHQPTNHATKTKIILYKTWRMFLLFLHLLLLFLRLLLLLLSNVAPQKRKCWVANVLSYCCRKYSAAMIFSFPQDKLFTAILINCFKIDWFINY